MVTEIRVNEDKLEFEDDELEDFRTLKQLAEVSLTGTETLTNKILTSPIINTPTVASPLFTGTIDGWIAAGETWIYASADAPTYTITVPTDATTKYSAGMRIKLKHNGSVKYFIITKVAATVLTLYGGTDYTLADTAITLPYYSVVKAPLGFPLSPNKWTVKTSDTTSRSQATPTQNTWYNLGAVGLVTPIGSWRVYYGVVTAIDTAAKIIQVTLSTANNSESDSLNTSGMEAQIIGERDYLSKELVMDLTSKTTLYLNTRTPSASSATIYNINTICALVIRAVCAFL
ncbi:MAG TPA: hypothetical protein VMV86_00565 [Methanosarcinales archaeon]|nr:hypothetical protein [Methanosarcinales archaeon]